MTEDVLRKPAPPPRWRWSAFLAMALETAIVITFFAHGSIFGLLLCAGYAWFSATWSLLVQSPPKQ